MGRGGVVEKKKNGRHVKISRSATPLNLTAWVLSVFSVILNKAMESNKSVG